MIIVCGVGLLDVCITQGLCELRYCDEIIGLCSYLKINLIAHDYAQQAEYAGLRAILNLSSETKRVPAANGIGSSGRRAENGWYHQYGGLISTSQLPNQSTTLRICWGAGKGALHVRERTVQRNRCSRTGAGTNYRMGRSGSIFTALIAPRLNPLIWACDFLADLSGRAENRVTHCRKAIP